MRLNKYLAKCGIGSRRLCDEFIRNKKIKINNIIITDFSYQIKENDYVQFNNKFIDIEPSNYYYILNKPKSYVCSRQDNKKRKIIYDLLPSKSRLFSVGRLDYDTTGLIIVTNDGDFCQRLIHPKYKIEKKYHVLTDQKLSNHDINSISNGIIVDKDKLTGQIYLLDKQKNKFLWDVVLTEGKNREIKRIFNFFNIKVLAIHRYQFSGIKLGRLKEGKFRTLTKNEINKTCFK